MPARLSASSKVPNSRDHGSIAPHCQEQFLSPCVNLWDLIHFTPKKNHKMKIHATLIVSHFIVKGFQPFPLRCAAVGVPCRRRNPRAVFRWASVLNGVTRIWGIHQCPPQLSLPPLNICVAWPWKQNIAFLKKTQKL